MSNKVAIILNDYTLMGGVERVTSNLVNLFLKNDIPLDCIITLNKKFVEPRIVYPKSVDVYLVKENEVVNFLLEKGISHVIIQVQDLRQAYNIVRLLKKNSNAMAIFPVLHNTPYAYIKRFLPIESFIDKLKYQKTRFYTKPKNLFYLRKITQLSDKFLMVSETAHNEIKQYLPKKYHNKIDFIYNPANLQPYNTSAEKKNTIIYAGRLVVDKRVFELTKVLGRLLKEYPNWQFHILGEGSEYDIINNYITENDLYQVKLLGNVSDVHARLNTSKICILYSYFEGLPTSLLEGAFTDNVLISSDSKGGARDIIYNGINGYIIKDEEDLILKMKFLLDNPSVIHEMMFSNHNIVTKFEESKIADKWKVILGF